MGIATCTAGNMTLVGSVERDLYLLALVACERG